MKLKNYFKVGDILPIKGIEHEYLTVNSILGKYASCKRISNVVDFVKDLVKCNGVEYLCYEREEYGGSDYFVISEHELRRIGLIKEYTFQDFLDNKIAVRINNKEEEDLICKMEGYNYFVSTFHHCDATFPYYRMGGYSWMPGDSRQYFEDRSEAVVNFKDLSFKNMENKNYKTIGYIVLTSDELKNVDKEGFTVVKAEEHPEAFKLIEEDIKICGQIAKFSNCNVTFGCATISKEIIKAVQELLSICEKGYFTLSVTRDGYILINEDIVSQDTISKILNKI